MALPKEPRQKMINMMYLVLTALLALNVSSEILNAFKIVNNSIGTSNRIIGEKNDEIYKRFDAELGDPLTRAKAEIWKPKADQVKKLSEDMYSYLENLKESLKREAGYKPESGDSTFKEDNLDAATRLMETNGKGKELYDKLTAYRKDLIAILNPEEFNDNPTFKGQLINQIKEFEKSIPIDLSVPKGQEGKEYSNDAKGWTLNYFHMTPSVAGLTILSKFQNDVRNSESQIVDYCHDQIGSVKVQYDEFEAIAQANRTYAMPGEEIEITAGVGSFSSAAKPVITVNGQNVALTGGRAIYKTRAGGAGEYNIPVKIRFTKQDGTVAEKTEIVKYTVGVPSGASVFLQKMNVLYIGVDNPMTISGGSVGREKVRVSFPAGEIRNDGGDNYIAKPSGPEGKSKIVVTANGKEYAFEMRIKTLPPPTAFVGEKKGGSMSASEFRTMGGVSARYENSDFEAKFRVVSYRLSAVGGNVSTYQEASNSGNRWTGAASNLVDRCSAGTTVFIDEIFVVGPDGKQRSISPMKFNLK
jgi:gliding motility-associated protein GldM